MKIKNTIRFVPLLLLAVFLQLQSCDNTPDPVIPQGADGFFVVNEGAFTKSNTSISFFDRKAHTMTNNVFTAKNGRPLGDQSQSMTVADGKGYIVVQNSAKVEVIDATDFSSIKTITTGLESPRYFIAVSSTKGYVSDWGTDGVTGTVKVIDLGSYEVIKTIPTGQGANRMLMKDNIVYLTNAGGYGLDNTVKKIDVTTDEVTGTITVADNPNSLQLDSDGNIWITCSGNLLYNEDFSINEDASTKSSVVKLSPAGTISLTITLPRFSYGTAGHLEISPDGNTLYFNYDDAIYSMNIAGTELPGEPFINKSYYGLAVDPFNGNIICGEALSFSAAGKIDIYDSTGVFQESFEVGIAPNGCAFK